MQIKCEILGETLLQQHRHTAAHAAGMLWLLLAIVACMQKHSDVLSTCLAGIGGSQ